MKGNLKLTLTVLAIMLTFIFVGMMGISLKLDDMASRAKDRYLNTVVAVAFTRDRIKALEEKAEVISGNINSLLTSIREAKSN